MTSTVMITHVTKQSVVRGLYLLRGKCCLVNILRESANLMLVLSNMILELLI